MLHILQYMYIYIYLYSYVLCTVNRNWHKFSSIPKDNFSGSMFSFFAGRSGHPKSNGLTMLNVYALFWLLVLDLGPFTMSTNPNVSYVGCKVIVCYSYLLSTYSMFFWLIPTGAAIGIQSRLLTKDRWTWSTSWYLMISRF